MTERTPALSRRPPAWLRRGIIFVLVAVAAFQAADWAFLNLSRFLGLLFLAWLFAISLEPVVHLLEDRGMRRGAATGWSCPVWPSSWWSSSSSSAPSWSTSSAS